MYFYKCWTDEAKTMGDPTKWHSFWNALDFYSNQSLECRSTSHQCVNGITKILRWWWCIVRNSKNRTWNETLKHRIVASFRHFGKTFRRYTSFGGLLRLKFRLDMANNMVVCIWNVSEWCRDSCWSIWLTFSGVCYQERFGMIRHILLLGDKAPTEVFLLAACISFGTIFPLGDGLVQKALLPLSDPPFLQPP